MVYPNLTRRQYLNQTTLFLLFILLRYMLHLISAPTNFNKQQAIMMVIVSGLPCLSLVLYDFRSSPNTPRFLWVGGLLLALPFHTILLCSQQPTYLPQVMISVACLPILADRKTAFTMIIAALLFFCCIYPTGVPSSCETSHYLTAVNLVNGIWLLALVFFLAHQNNKNQAQTKLRKQLVRKALAQDIRKGLEIGSPLSLMQDLQEKPHITFDVTFRRDDFENILNKAAFVQRQYLRTIKQTFALQRFAEDGYIRKESFTIVNVGLLAYRVVDVFPFGIQQHIKIALCGTNKDFCVFTVPTLFHYVMKTLLGYAVLDRKANNICLRVSAASRKLYIIDNGERIPHRQQSNLWDIAQALRQKTDVGFACSKLILDALHINIALDTTNKRTVFTIGFPKLPSSLSQNKGL